MHRNPVLDLGYTHETAAVPPREPVGSPTRADAARDLSARLRCLKMLIDAERAEQARLSWADPYQRGLH